MIQSKNAAAFFFGPDDFVISAFHNQYISSLPNYPWKVLWRVNQPNNRHRSL